MPCLCICVCMGACDVGRDQPCVSMEAVQQETHGFVKGDPQGMWNFSLPEEMAILAGGKPHGAEPHCQCWMEGKGVVRGRWHPLPPVNGKWELYLCWHCVFRFQALQAGTVPYCLYSPWPSKSWSLPGHPGTSAVLMSNSRPCNINSTATPGYMVRQAQRRTRRSVG